MINGDSGVSRHWLTCLSATRSRATLARMSSAVAVQMNGFGSSFGQVALDLGDQVGHGVEHAAAQVDLGDAAGWPGRCRARRRLSRPRPPVMTTIGRRCMRIGIGETLDASGRRVMDSVVVAGQQAPRSAPGLPPLHRCWAQSRSPRWRTASRTIRPAARRPDLNGLRGVHHVNPNFARPLLPRPADMDQKKYRLGPSRGHHLASALSCDRGGSRGCRGNR